MVNQESINRKKFLMTLGFSGAALMAALSSCVYKQADQPSPIILLPNAPTVSASTIVNSPISITTESAGTVVVYNNGIVVESITVKAGVNTYIPISTGNFTFVLQTNEGNSPVSAVVLVSPKTNTTPVAPTVSIASVNTNNPITINISQAGTIIVFNGTTQVESFAAVIGSNTYTPISDGTYTFKIQTTGGISPASNAVNVSTISATKDLLTLDLSLAANANLKKIGGYIRQNNIVVALIATDTYAAVTQICSHEGRKEIILQNGEFYCTAHGARYTTKGVGLNSDGRGGLTVYKTNLASNILHVYA
jgi:cytochrome b6-f complex iron-sulfur subunit